MSKKELKLAIIGFGNIGREVFQNTPFIKEGTETYLKANLKPRINRELVYFRVVGIADSKSYVYGNFDDPLPESKEPSKESLKKSARLRELVKNYKKEKHGSVQCIVEYLNTKKENFGALKSGSTKATGGSELLKKLKEAGLVPDVVIDVTPTRNPASEGDDKVIDRIAFSLEMGSNVVLANKAPVAYHFDAVKKLSELYKRAVRCEATVCAEVPFLDEISKHKQKIVYVMGIINGTTNYILDRMAGGAPYATAFNEAKARGLTETDPGEDTLGIDAARKLLIISQLAESAVKAESILVSGINEMWTGIRWKHFPPTSEWTLAKLEKFKAGYTPEEKDYRPCDSLTGKEFNDNISSGNVPKLIAKLNFVNGSGNVSLEWVPKHHPLAHVDGAKNKIILYKEGERVLLESRALRGAGPEATANAIFRDCMVIAGNTKAPYKVSMFK